MSFTVEVLRQDQVPVPSRPSAATECGRCGALTAARVAWAIANRNPRIAQMGATELMAWQAEARREQARSFEDYLRRMNDYRPVDGSWPWMPLPEGVAA